MIRHIVMGLFVFSSASAAWSQEGKKDDLEDVKKRLEEAEKRIKQLEREKQDKDGKKEEKEEEKKQEEPKRDKRQEQEPPTITITAGQLVEEAPIGPYGQSEWVEHRRSPVTRIYLQVPPGEVEFEQWFEFRSPKGDNNQVRMSEEFEFGLGYRFQLDLYFNTIFVAKGTDSTTAIRSVAAEIRWAFANWGEIWGNPTLYLEYIQWNNQPDAQGDGATSSIEPKLLWGGEIAPRWHWGANFFYERTLGNKDAQVAPEMGATLTVSYTLLDQFLSIGVSAQTVYEVDTVSGEVSSRTRELYIGPSMQLRLAPYETVVEHEENGVRKKVKITKTKAHLDIEPLWGIGPESLNIKIFIVFGWDF